MLARIKIVNNFTFLDGATHFFGSHFVLYSHSMKTKLLVLLTIFIDVLGIGIIIPVLPGYVHSFGVSDVVVTLLFAAYAFFAFFSGPFLGSLSDRIGRRPVLIVSIISTALGWLLFAQAWSVVILFVGRIIDGLAAGNITAAQSALADIAKNDQERTVNMGLFGAIFGVGFIIGPALGGILALWGSAVPFYGVGILALVNAFAAFFWLPETHLVKDTEKKISYNPFAPIRDGFRDREMRGLFFVWFLFAVALSVQQGTFALYVQRVFGMSEQMTAWLFAGIGILIVINQMVFLKKVWLRYFKKRTLALVMLLVLAFGMITQAAPWMWVFMIGLVAATFGQGNLRTVFSSMIAQHRPEKRGEYLGISASLMSLAMVIGPLIATFTYIQHPQLPFIIAAGILLVAYSWYKFMVRVSEVS